MAQKNMVIPTAIITGASKGIGRAIALELAYSNKYKLALISRNMEQLKETDKLCKGINANIQTRVIQCDISNVESFKQIIDNIANDFGPLCILINNAGILYKERTDSDKIDFKMIDKSIDINLRSLMHATIHSVNYIKESKGKYPNLTCAIIQIASRASTLRVTNPAMSIYTATKFGVRAFTNCLFEEIGDCGIKVSCLMPGFVKSDMIDDHGSFKNQLIPEKMMKPQDVGYAVNFILNCPDSCCPLEMLIIPQYQCISKL